MSDTFLTDADYAEDSANVGMVTAVEQSTGSKNSMFRGMGRNIPVATYQWVIVVGAVALLWAMGYSLRADLKIG